MTTLITAYNSRPSYSASTSNGPIPSAPQVPGAPPTVNVPNIGRSGGSIRGERGGTTQQNAVPTGRTTPNRFDAGNISGNTPLNSSLPHIAAVVSPANPELTKGISNKMGKTASELIIRRGDLIIVYLRNSTGHAVGFNSTIGLGGVFRAELVRRVEPQPNLETIIAIARCSRGEDDHRTPYHAASIRNSSPKLSSPDTADRETYGRGTLPLRHGSHRSSDLSNSYLGRPYTEISGREARDRETLPIRRRSYRSPDRSCSDHSDFDLEPFPFEIRGREARGREARNRETSPLHSAAPNLEYNAQDYIIVCSRQGASWYGLNVRTELMGRFKKEDVRIVSSKEKSNSNRRRAGRTENDRLGELLRGLQMS
jgi:hypothetical protein